MVHDVPHPVLLGRAGRLREETAEGPPARFLQAGEIERIVVGGNEVQGAAQQGGLVGRALRENGFELLTLEAAEAAPEGDIWRAAVLRVEPPEVSQGFKGAQVGAAEQQLAAKGQAAQIVDAKTLAQGSSAQQQATSAPLARRSSSPEVAKSAVGPPAAANSRSSPRRQASSTVRRRCTWPNGGTPPMA